MASSPPLSALLAFNPDSLVFLEEDGRAAAASESPATPASSLGGNGDGFVYFSASMMVLNCSATSAAILKIQTNAPSGRASVRPNYARLPPRGNVEIAFRVKLERGTDAKNVSWRFRAVWALDPTSRGSRVSSRFPTRDTSEWSGLWALIPAKDVGSMSLKYEFIREEAEDARVLSAGDDMVSVDDIPVAPSPSSVRSSGETRGESRSNETYDVDVVEDLLQKASDKIKELERNIRDEKRLRQAAESGLAKQMEESQSRQHYPSWHCLEAFALVAVCFAASLAATILGGHLG